MSYHYPFSRGETEQIITGKHKSGTGTVDVEVALRSMGFQKHHSPCHNLLLNNRLVITIDVYQVEVLAEIVSYHQQFER